MSEFIKSIITSTETKEKKLKFLMLNHRQSWQVHIIPSIQFFYKTKKPQPNRYFWKYGISGLYLSVTWLTYYFTFGIFKKP